MLKKFKIKAYPINNPDSVFDKMICNHYKTVEEEHGWRVIIDGKWYQKQDGPRLYASKNSAKKRTEQELAGEFGFLFRKEYPELYNQADKFTYPDGNNGKIVHDDSQFGIDEWYDTISKSFRLWLNNLYANGRIKYEYF